MGVKNTLLFASAFVASFPAANGWAETIPDVQPLIEPEDSSVSFYQSANLLSKLEVSSVSPPEYLSSQIRKIQWSPIEFQPRSLAPVQIQQPIAQAQLLPQETTPLEIIPVAAPADRPQALSSPSPPERMAEMPSVSQLSDVQMSDWAYQALQSLVERHSCIGGYPDHTFRGNRSLTRFEFAAALNACLERISQSLGTAIADTATREDLVVIERLQVDFTTELATLRDRVDTLEAQTAVLEGQAFSTTAILGGEVILGLADAWGGGPPGDGKTNPIFAYSANLQLVSSFNGKDRLRLQLESDNFGDGGFANPSALNSQGALLSFQSDTQNQFVVGSLEYRFSALNDRVVFTVQPVGFSLSSVLTTNSPFFSNSQGSLSRFGQFSPLFRIGNPESGVGADWLINRRLRLQAAYGTTDAGSPDSGFVFGKQGYVLGGQVLLLPTDHLQIGLGYITGYSPDGRLNTFTGSRVADASGFIDVPAQIHALNTTLQWEISPKVTLSTWAGVAVTYAARLYGGAVSTTYAASLGIRDPFGRQQGDLLGIVFGQPLSLVEVNDFQGSTGLVTDGATSFHAELFYRFRLNDHLSITPGVFMVTNPGNFADNNTIYVGAIRTAIKF
jgi:hypothetical protein